MNLSKILVLFCMSTFALYGQLVDKVKQKASENRSSGQSADPPPSRSNNNYNNSYRNNDYNRGSYNGRRGNNYNYNYNNGYYNGYNNYNNGGYYYDPNYANDNISGRNTSAATQAMFGQFDVLGRKDSVPEVVCIELSENVSFTRTGLGNAWIHNPHLRLTWGLFSTEFRYFDLMDRSPITNKINHYQNFDWQILQLNLLCRKEIKFRVGLGFTNDMYLSKLPDSNNVTKSVNYLDFGMGGEVYPTAALKFRLEYRGNMDFNSDICPRSMWTFGAEYKLFGDHTTRFVGFAGVNGNRVRLFEDDQLTFWSLGPSLTIRLQ